MITLKEWMELVDYRITEGDNYGWQCFGYDAYSLSSWNGDHEGWSFNIVFDTRTQEVYTVEVCDYLRERAYRLLNEEYKNAHDEEAKDRGELANQAWDGVNFIDLEDDDDFIQKGLAIKSGEDYDTRVSVPLNLPDDTLFELMKLAHEKDVTLNELMEDIIRNACEEALADPEAYKRKMDLEDDLGPEIVEFEPAPSMMKAKKKKKK